MGSSGVAVAGGGSGVAVGGTSVAVGGRGVLVGGAAVVAEGGTLATGVAVAGASWQAGSAPSSNSGRRRGWIMWCDEILINKRAQIGF